MFSKVNLKNARFLDCICLIALSILVVLSSISGVYNNNLEYSLDHGLAFEGGYRILKGQIPYRDFYIPTGPVVYYIQALFNYIFGMNLIAIGMHTAIMAVILCSYFFCILRRDFNRLISFVLTYVLFFSFCGVIYYPFHNLAAFFFLLLNFLILIDREIINLKIVFLSIILCALSFFSKQDTGLLQSVFVGSYILLFSKNRFKHCFCFLLGLLVIVFSTMFFFNNTGNFFTHFNFCGPPFPSRINWFFTASGIQWILTNSQFYLIVLSVFLWRNKKYQSNKEFIFLLFGINFITLIVSVTSSVCEQTILESIPLSLYLIFTIFKDDIKNLSDISQFKTWFVCLLSVIYLLPIARAFFHLAKISVNSYAYSRISCGSYKGLALPSVYLLDLYKIQSILNKQKDFLNITTNHQFFYQDHNIDPPKPMPLWFDYRVSFFDKEVFRLVECIKEKRPKIILIDEELCVTIRELSLDSFMELGYKEIFSTELSGATGGDLIRVLELKN